VTLLLVGLLALLVWWYLAQLRPALRARAESREQLRSACAAKGHPNARRIFVMDDPRYPVNICPDCGNQEHLRRTVECPKCGESLRPQ
jgi:hypothetical protein